MTTPMAMFLVWELRAAQYVPLADARAVPTVTDDGVRYARWHQACLRAGQREEGVRR